MHFLFFFFWRNFSLFRNEQASCPYFFFARNRGHAKLSVVRVGRKCETREEQNCIPQTYPSSFNSSWERWLQENPCHWICTSEGQRNRQAKRHSRPRFLTLRWLYIAKKQGKTWKRPDRCAFSNLYLTMPRTKQRRLQLDVKGRMAWCCRPSGVSHVSLRTRCLYIAHQMVGLYADYSCYQMGKGKSMVIVY